MDHYDFVVIGGGSAGYAGARTACALGLKAAVIEGGRDVGGLCILRGCMPSKTLLESSHRFRAFRHARDFGLRADGIGFDAVEIVKRKNRLIGEFADYRREQLETGTFDFLRGRAVFEDPNTLNVSLLGGGEKQIRASTILIATGSSASVPPVPGLAESGAWISDDLLDCTDIPASIIVLGGGPVALEMATFCRGLGSSVTVIQRGKQLLTGTDADAARAVEEGMRAEGIDIFTGTSITGISRTAEGTRVDFQHNGKAETVTAARLLNALGRSAALGGLEHSGVQIAQGKVAVGEDQRTSVPHIFAAGDVCGPFEVVHVAIQQGEVAAANAARHLNRLGGPAEQMDYRLKLFAVFSEPQFACVGATEAELTAAGIPFVSARYPFADHGKSLVLGETAGFVKLIAHESTREILGGSVVGPQASELIHEIVVAMHFRSTAGTLAKIPHYHPTLSEIWTYPADELASPKD